MDSDLKFDDLKLLPGTKLDLRSEQYSSLKGLSIFLGHQTHNIIVSTPLQSGKPIACHKDSQVVVRFFVNHLNCACAFRTKINYTSITPFPHLFLAIPDKMEIGEVRNNVRANVNLICSVNSYEEYRKKNQSALINNLSVDGLKLLSKEFLGEEQEEIAITIKIKVLETEKILKIDGIIRSTSELEGQFSYGIQFKEVSEPNKLLIYAYVMSQIVR